MTRNGNSKNNGSGNQGLGRARQAGMFLAAATAPQSFERTLMPRTNRDQGIITGLNMALNYGIGVVVQDAVEGIASLMVGSTEDRQADDTVLRRVSLGTNVSVAGLGFLLQTAFKQEDNESLLRAGLRTGGFTLSKGAVAGLGVGLLQEWLASIDRRATRDRRLRRIPVALIGGGALAAVTEALRRRREAQSFGSEDAADVASAEWNIRAGQAAGIGMGVTAAMGALTIGEAILARGVAGALSYGFPGGEKVWHPAAHLAILGGLLGGIVWGVHKVNQRVEAGVTMVEHAYDDPPLSALASGGPGSVVSWDTMSREGRRFASTYLRPRWIEAVMGEPPKAEPIRIFVGLDSAPTDAERVNLAIQEMERTGAFDREVIMACSPTGTGYVNYVTVESLEYMTRGNCATVTLQYSKRPSPMSMDRVWLGRKQFRMLIGAIHRRMYRMEPDKRPRLVVFGESLGAHTSQDGFLHSGTQGLEDAGVERALWIGTPNLSKWKHEVLGTSRPDVDRELVGEFDSFEDVEAMDPEARAKLRYVMITHGNDGVAYFGPDLLVQQPKWLGPAESRPPRVPRHTKYTTPATFLQTLIDMNNAMSVVPGQFEAKGHDYRADLARFVREVYALPCTDEQLDRIETALRRYELIRGKLLEAQDADSLPEEFSWEGRPPLQADGKSAAKSEV